MPLPSAPCRSLCSWAPLPSSYAGQGVLACAGCGSQWAPSEGWTPRQADGSVPSEVRRLRAGGAGSAGS